MAISRLLVIGLDGATFDVLSPLMQDGTMPNLAALVRRGCWGKLASTIPPFTAAAWSTFITGANPGQHGVLSFRATRDSFTYDLQGKGFVDAQRFDSTLWEMIGAGGRRTGIVNVPLTYPPRPVNGAMITGMLTPPGATQYVYPPQLRDTLDPDYVIDVDFIRGKDGFAHASPLSKSEMMAQIQNMSRVRARTCVRLVQEETWDFFMVVFTGTDRVQHFFWDDLELLIGDQGRVGQIEDTEIGSEIRNYFRELDESIAGLVQAAGPSADLFLISDHGFGPAQTRRFYVNVWLESLGLLQRRRAKGAFDLEHLRVQIGRHRRLKALLRRLLPDSTQQNVRKITESVSGEFIEWSATRAYFVPIYFHVCGIEINLAGQRREGIVPTGPEYESLRDLIIEAALQLCDPEDGRRIVEIAARREDLFSGPHVDQFPDIILVLDPDYLGIWSVAGSSLTEANRAQRPGEHRQDGVFVGAGPSLAQQNELDGLRLLDIPATIMYTLGLPVPPSFDGRVLEEIFDPEYLRTHPILFAEPPQASEEADRALSSPEEGYTEEEEAALADRLRGLGYLD